MPIKYCCHFCGRSDSLNKIEKLGIWLCATCWEIIAFVASKWYAAGAKVLETESEDVGL